MSDGIQRYSLALLAIGTLLVWTTGCDNPATAPPEPAQTEDGHAGHAHDHPTEGPHGGKLVEFGEEEYHGEWTHDEAGKVSFWILDGSVKEDVPIEAEALTITVKMGETNIDYNLEAANMSAETNKASEYTLVNKQLAQQLGSVGHGVEASIAVNIQGKEFVGEFEHGHEH